MSCAFAVPTRAPRARRVARRAVDRARRRPRRRATPRCRRPTRRRRDGRRERRRRRGARDDGRGRWFHAARDARGDDVHVDEGEEPVQTARDRRGRDERGGVERV